MAVIIQLNFPAKRYHATPWGSHVNEGQIEWPPSPWRILRALISVGFTKLGWSQKPPAVARSLIAKLASVLPTYALPETTEAHTRHYVTAGPKKPLIFDTWARIKSGYLQVSWDLELSDDERNLLGQFVSRLSYLGRAESWVNGELLSVGAKSLRPNAFPAQSGEGAPGRSWEAVTLLAPIAAQDYLEWRTPRIENALEGLEPAKGKKISKALEKKRVAAVAPFPKSLWDCLTAETGWLDRYFWSRPPGSQDVLYWREPQRSVVQSRRGSLKVAPMEFALFSLEGKNRNKGVLPVLERVYPQARLVHKTLAWFVGELKAGAEAASSLLGVKVND
ncbi:MAG: type I-U CRISPR-associated protein Csb2, partial [Planctomycetota bacterium]|nr:type I-U CRISPR-associated protein Csb2 [Planctomycetota bacterium]